MGYKETYEAWLEGAYFDEATKAELQAIKDNDKEICSFLVTATSVEPP